MSAVTSFFSNPLSGVGALTGGLFGATIGGLANAGAKVPQIPSPPPPPSIEPQSPNAYIPPSDTQGSAATDFTSGGQGASTTLASTYSAGKTLLGS